MNADVTKLKRTGGICRQTYNDLLHFYPVNNIFYLSKSQQRCFLTNSLFLLSVSYPLTLVGVRASVFMSIQKAHSDQKGYSQLQKGTV